MNKTIIIIIIILIVVIGGYFLLRGEYQDSNLVSAPTPASGVDPGTVEEKIVSDGTGIKEFTVSGTEYSFNPSSLDVKAGEQIKIIFKNDGKAKHNLVIEELGIKTRTIGVGQTDILEFIAPSSGTYVFSCSIPGHQAAGMEGSLRVE